MDENVFCRSQREELSLKVSEEFESSHLQGENSNIVPTINNFELMNHKPSSVKLKMGPKS
jgi:hypothetical protein